MTYENSLQFAQAQDQQDPLRKYREQFYFPQVNGRDAVYFTGNSLGLQPKSAKAAIEVELEDWASLGVEGHFEGRNPWMHYHEFLTEKAARLVGAKPIEVVVMNNLTVNLHLMMVSFYRPTKERFKIITEAGAFPSDQYALETQTKFHGFNPDEALVELKPREGEYTLRTEDILAAIREHGNELALVMMGGVNYYTGQAFDMAEITKAGHAVGAQVGFDLAHAAGNLVLNLHDWDVDFAVWCSYKYLNSGPGGTSGVFVHERHATNPNLPRFAGWWGHDKEVRFKMQKGFKPMAGAAGWQLSNAQIFPMAIHNASLKIFDEVGMPALREKSEKLTGYLEFLINGINAEGKTKSFEMITPSSPKDRGAQISLLATHNGRELFDKLTQAGVIADWREPTVYHYENNDIVFVNINPNGSIDWISRVPKHQHTVNDGGAYNSYSLSVMNDKIFMVFNDNVKNLKISDPRKMKVMTKPHKAVTMLVTMDNTGNFRKQALFPARDAKTIVRPAFYMQDDKSVIIYSETGRDYRFGNISFN